MNKHTKKTLLLSILALILCCAMLAGTTFAWFTDTVKTGKNEIKAGKLDVELYHTNGSGTEEEVEEDTSLFEIDKWEPGMAAYEKFTVKNKGNLALKFDLDFNNIVSNHTTHNGRDYSLKDVLYVKTSNVELTREALTKASGTRLYDYFDASLMLDKHLDAGHLSPENASNTVVSSQDVYVYIYWPASDIVLDTEGEETSNPDNYLNVAKAGNGDYDTSDKKPLSVTLTIALNATQYTEEIDSFNDNQYDNNASYR